MTQANPRNHYETLGLNYDASEEEIRRQYHDIVRTLHPDRRRLESTVAEDQFHQVQSAWTCLKDNHRRLPYDISTFGYTSLTGETGPISARQAETEIVQLQREHAQIDIRNMQITLEQIRKREQAERGILIRKALYGNLILKEERWEEVSNRTIEADDLQGPVIDVAIPLQCLVENHSIVVPGSSFASKSSLPGFYNPCPLDAQTELSLYVLYEFRGRLHEVAVEDCETLRLPCRRHHIPPGKIPRGPFSNANIKLLSVQITSSTSSRSGRLPHSQRKAEAKKVLHRAIVAYRFQRFSEHSKGDATLGEFVTVFLSAASILALGMRWMLKN